MVMSKRTFDLVGGFNTSFREYYFDADFCLKAQRLLNKKIVYTPNAILLSNVESDRSDETDFEQSKEDLNVFQQGWGELLAREIEYIFSDVFFSLFIVFFTIVLLKILKEFEQHIDIHPLNFSFDIC
jgi:GT2 family glycosyltransferase